MPTLDEIAGVAQSVSQEIVGFWCGGADRANGTDTISDQEIQQLENQFPAVSGSAFAAARERVLASGQSVLQSQDGVIYEVFPDGRRAVVKEIEPPTHFASGSTFILR